MSALIKQVQYLTENGFTKQQANTLIYFHKDNIENVMATKKDIAEVKKEIATVQANLKRDIEQLRADTKRDIEYVRKDIESMRKDLLLKLSGIIGSMIIIGVAILGLLIKL